MEEEGACSIDAINHLKEKYSDGFFLIVTQPGCGHCEEMKRTVLEVVQDKKPVIEASTEDKDCVSLAEKLDVSITPTVFYIKKDEQKKVVEPDGTITYDNVRQILSTLS